MAGVTIPPIQLKRTHVGTVPSSLQPGEIMLDYGTPASNGGSVYWQDSSGTMNKVPFTVAGIIAAVGATAPNLLNTIKALADAIGDDASFAADIATQLGARIRVDAAQSLSATQQQQALANLGALPQLGQCRLQYTSATQVTLIPYNGNKLFINGLYYTIPAAGVSLSNTNLSNGNFYYVYAYVSSGAITLEASATGRATSATYGHQIKGGSNGATDPTRTLVGMVAVNGINQFENDTSIQNVRSWFNRIPIAAYNSPRSQPSTGSTSPVQLYDACYFLVWADEPVNIEMFGCVYAPNGGVSPINCIYLNGNLWIQGQVTCNQGYTESFNLDLTVFLNEGLNSIAPFGYTDNGNTANWSWNQFLSAHS